MALNVFCLGLVYTSATLAAATTNCLPVTTFFFAVLLRYFPATFSYPHIEFFLLFQLTSVNFHVLHCRMEKVTIKTTPGIAKVVGLAVCMAGVATLAFYGGPQLNPSIHYPFLGNNHDTQQDHQAHASFGKTWILGCFLLFLSIVSWGLWLVLQVGNRNCSPTC